MPLIHTCYRITDVDRSIAFYKALGFEEVGRIPIGDEAINVFMNQPGDGDMPRLELTYNFGINRYDLGTGANLDLYNLAHAADGTWRTQSSIDRRRLSATACARRRDATQPGAASLSR